MMLQWKTIYPSKTLLSFSDRSIYYLMVEKNVVAMAKFQSVRGAFHHLTFMDNCQKFCVTSCVSPTVPVNDLAFFCFLLCTRCWLCCCGWITQLEENISLPYLIGNRQTLYAYISALIVG